MRKELGREAPGGRLSVVAEVPASDDATSVVCGRARANVAPLTRRGRPPSNYLAAAIQANDKRARLTSEINKKIDALADRVDETIIFRRLTREQIGQIVEIQLQSVSNRLGERNIALRITPAARDLLATLGYEPAYGARPLKRVIQKQILDPLARKLLGGEIHDGETVTIDANENGFTFTGTFTNARTAA